MKKLILLFLSILIIPSLSCKTNKESVFKEVSYKNEKIPGINFDNIPVIEEGIKLSDVFSEVKIIPLETRPECVIGNTKIEFIDDNIYVGTQNFPGAAKLYRFDSKGRFLNEIGKEGNGPGEHTGYLLTQINQLDESDKICVTWIGEPQVFTAEGEFVNEVKQPFILLGNTYHYGDNEWFSPGSCTGIPQYQRDSVNIIFYNTEGEIIKIIPRLKYPSSNDYTPSFGLCSVYKFENAYHIYNPGNDTIFKIVNKELIPYFSLDFGQEGPSYNNTMSPVDLPGKFAIEILAETRNNLFISKQIITEADINEYKPGQWSGAFRTESMIIVLDKIAKLAFQGKIVDDMLNFIPQESFYYNLSWGKDIAFLSLQAIDLIKIKTSNSNDLPDIFSKIGDISENSNPIIICFKIKDKIKVK